MDLIVASPDGTVPSLDVINASADLEKRMTITYAEELIARLLKDKWMSEVSITNKSIASIVSCSNSPQVFFT